MKEILEYIAYGIGIVAGIIGYTAGLLAWVRNMIADHTTGCRAMSTAQMESIQKRIDTTEHEIGSVITNYKERFEDMKKEIREVKQDIIQRIDLLVEALKKSKE